MASEPSGQKTWYVRKDGRTQHVDEATVNTMPMWELAARTAEVFDQPLDPSTLANILDDWDATARRFQEAEAELARRDARIADLQAQLREAQSLVSRIERIRCWTNEDGKRFMFADEITDVLLTGGRTWPSGQTPDSPAKRDQADLDWTADDEAEWQTRNAAGYPASMYDDPSFTPVTTSQFVSGYQAATHAIEADR